MELYWPLGTAPCTSSLSLCRSSAQTTRGPRDPESFGGPERVLSKRAHAECLQRGSETTLYAAMLVCLDQRSTRPPGSLVFVWEAQPSRLGLNRVARRCRRRVPVWPNPRAVEQAISRPNVAFEWTPLRHLAHLPA